MTRYIFQRNSEFYTTKDFGQRVENQLLGDLVCMPTRSEITKTITATHPKNHPPTNSIDPKSRLLDVYVHAVGALHKRNRKAGMIESIGVGCLPVLEVFTSRVYEKEASQKWYAEGAKDASKDKKKMILTASQEVCGD